jgi:hypothetical protein
MIAISHIRKDPCYRSDAFSRGLRACGYHLCATGRPNDKRDLLVIWNRYGSNEAIADQWEQRGGSVIVAENGYIGKDANGIQLYAISVHGHNGAGWFPVGDTDRFSALGIALKPWRKTGEHVLVCGQRGIGSRTMASPAGWHDRAAMNVSAHLNRVAKIRMHPGRHAPATALEDDLANAWACMIWSSGSGVKSLVEGVPVIYDAPSWIASGAAVRLKDADALCTDDAKRLAALQRMSWGQWRIAEIESGEPFARILQNIESVRWD